MRTRLAGQPSVRRTSRSACSRVRRGAGATGEDLGDLPGVEAQVFEGHLADLVVELEAGRGDGRLEPREQNDVDVAGQVGQQVVERAVELVRRDRLVVVVDHDVELAVDLVAQLRDEQRGHLGRRDRHFVGFGEALDQDAAEGGHAFADGLHQRGDEDGGVVVEDVESVPDGAPAEPARGFGDDRGLAIAGRCAHDEQPLARAPAELVEHVRPDEGASDVGRGDLGGDERRCADYRATAASLVDPPLVPPIQGPAPPIQSAHYTSRTSGGTAGAGRPRLTKRRARRDDGPARLRPRTGSTASVSPVRIGDNGAATPETAAAPQEEGAARHPRRRPASWRSWRGRSRSSSG